MLTLKNIAVARDDHTLLHKINLQLPQGGKAVITGPSGSGKSSLLAVIYGMLPPAEGKVICDGIEVNPANIPHIRQIMAVIEQEPVLAANYVEEAIMMPFEFKLNARMQKPDQQKIIRTLAEFNLPASILAQPCAELSGGEKQRVAVARIKLLERHVILADEATSALDDYSCNEVMNYLMKPELTVLAVSHDPRLIKSFPTVIEVKNHSMEFIRKETVV